MMIDAISATCLFIGFDWLVATRTAAYFSDFEYQFWPLSKHRRITAALMTLVVFVVIYIGPSIPLWGMIPTAGALTYWLGAILADVAKQRREYVALPQSDRYGG